MKAYKIEMIVVDHDGYGRETLITNLTQMRYYNPDILRVHEADIGEWTDDHPLNLNTTLSCEKRVYFGE